MLNFLAKHKTLIAMGTGYLLYDFLATKKKEKNLVERNCTVECPDEVAINEMNAEETETK